MIGLAFSVRRIPNKNNRKNKKVLGKIPFSNLFFTYSNHKCHFLRKFQHVSKYLPISESLRLKLIKRLKFSVVSSMLANFSMKCRLYLYFLTRCILQVKVKVKVSTKIYKILKYFLMLPWKNWKSCDTFKKIAVR